MRSLDLIRTALLAALPLCMSCETSKQIGSACRNGVCSEANAVALPMCLFSTISASVMFDTEQGAPDASGPSMSVFDGICLPHESHDCQLSWWLPNCEDFPFLSAEAGDVCRVAQVAAPDDDAGTAAGGFWYAAATRECSSGHAVRFTEPPSGTIVVLKCAEARAVDKDGVLSTIDGAQCKLPETSAKHADVVGKACLPEEIPASGFSVVEAYVETGSTQCETGACLVYKLQGDPSPGCTAPDGSFACSNEKEIQNRVYCSCRCDAPAGDPGALCGCPNDFTCLPVLPDAAPGIRGSYCVRNGTFISGINETAIVTP